MECIWQLHLTKQLVTPVNKKDIGKFYEIADDVKSGRTWNTIN